MRIERSIETTAPPERVWPLLVTPEEILKWFTLLESFEYTSGAPLPTPTGIMAGSYRMETSGGETFDVAIPAFSLDSPHHSARVN